MLLTVKVSADRLGISPGLVYSLVAGRKLRFVRIGNGRGRIRIPEEGHQGIPGTLDVRAAGAASAERAGATQAPPPATAFLTASLR